MLKVGERVVYVGDVHIDQIEINLGVRKPILNEIYTIRGFESSNQDLGIRVEEIKNPILKYADGICEKAYNVIHFRKLDTEFAENVLANITKQAKKEKMFDLTTI